MMHRVRRAPFLAILFGCAVVACGPRAETAGSKTPSAPLPGGGRSVEPGAPSVPWRDKTREQRVEFMGLVFFPKMQSLFEDGPRGSEPDEARGPFRCQTCHGEDMVDVAYRMPNGLFPLPKASTTQAALAHDEKFARFMMEQVVPVARELFGASDPDDVGCHSCHAVGELPARAAAR
jgi:hypothetical protein